MSGAYSNSSDKYAGNGWYWLRSPGSASKNAAVGSSYGDIDGVGSNVDIIRGVVRPALHLNLLSSKWSKAGTVNSLGEVNREETPPPTATPTSAPDIKEDETPSAKPSATPTGEEKSDVTGSKGAVTPPVKVKLKKKKTYYIRVRAYKINSVKKVYGS